MSEHLCPMDGMPLSRIVMEVGQPTEYHHRYGFWHYDRTVQITKDVQWTSVENASWMEIKGADEPGR